MLARTPSRGLSSLRRERWLGRLPRIALIVLTVVLSAAGLHSMVTAVSVEAPALDPASGIASDPSTTGLAEQFARAYLTLSPTDDRRTERLAAFGLPDQELAVDHAGRLPVWVRWTTVVSSAPLGLRRAVVTVEAETTSGTLDLAVTVGRDEAGRDFVATAPALVGPPQLARQQTPPVELEVDDRDLVATVTRALGHYLAGDASDLAPDLTPRAVVSVPASTYRLAAVQAVTWVTSPRRVAVALTARASDGSELSLRYELDVGRVAGRWLVARIQVNPRDPQENTP